MTKTFVDKLKEGPLLFDGGMGTMLQRLGLKPGGSPDELNVTDPKIVEEVHRAYLKAGSDVVTTNTFGATRIKLAEYGLGDRLSEINRAAVKNARAAVSDMALVAGGLGPTGSFLEPVGELTFDEARDIFAEQVTALKEGGADLIIIETMMDIREMKAAIVAVKEVSDLPLVATMTFDENMRGVLGTSPEVFAIVAEGLGADCLGANCSLGVEGILEAVRAMGRVTTLPLIAQPNAGIPYLKGDETVFPATPKEMSLYVPALVDAGVRVVGGCCGTTSEHIESMGDRLRSHELAHGSHRGEVLNTRLASRTGYVVFGGGDSPVIVGERINPTGRKVLAQEVKDGKTITTRKEAKGQVAAGAHLLDVNVGVPAIDEVAAMERAVYAVNENVHAPIVVDSSNLDALEAGLKAADGKVLINSVSGEEKKLETVLPLAKKYGAAVLGLTLDDDGIPDTAGGRVKVARKIMERAEKVGIKKSDVVIDCLAMTVSAVQEGAKETLKAIQLVKEELGLSTILGVSNISFGLPGRETVNATFLTMAIKAGLDAAIINPYNDLMMDAYHASLVLLGYDLRSELYIKRFQERSGTVVAPKRGEKEGAPGTLDERLRDAIIEGDEERIVLLVEEALRQGWEPMRITNEGLLKGLEEVGRRFAANIYFLPQVMLSAETMKRAFARLKVEIKDNKEESLGKILMATVEGDIHDIGKNIVSTLLENHGFEVIDLGKNVATERIVEEAIKQKVDMVGLSALMTTTVMEMDNVIKRLKEEGVNVFTMVGGAVVTDEFADKIEASGYAKDAMEAVKKIKKLLNVSDE
ncbi:MAG: dihydropteroate synthase [Deltaproteobacteria bacterium]|nr:dihydropteroate synthase [Deltaproteobacteria bacterium]